MRIAIVSYHLRTVVLVLTLAAHAASAGELNCGAINVGTGPDNFDIVQSGNLFTKKRK